MDVEASRAVSRELARDERLLWSGRPRRGVVFRGTDLLMVPFSLLWGGFAFFWEYEVISSGKAPFFFMLWGIPFVLVGLYIIAGRFFVDSYQRGRTYYGLTTERIVIVSGIFGRKVKSLPLRSLPELSLSERSNGNGTIVFGSSGLDSLYRGFAWPGVGQRMAPAFDLIENARQVYGRVREAQREVA